MHRDNLKKTPLFEEHKRLGAKFTGYAGWELPLYFSGIIEEHMAVRSSAGLFDVSHLGKIDIQGEKSTEFLQYLTPIDINNIAVDGGAYTVFCREDGGILDDDIIYRFKSDEYLVITNASRVDVLLEWFNKHIISGIEIKDRTEEFCLLALQGPDSPSILKAVFKEDSASYKRYMAKNIELGNNRFTVMKSGYTGEEGYEIMAGPDVGRNIWRMLLASGVKPAGLGARDTLRLEMGYLLYGRDLREEVTPVEAGLKWLISFEKEEFIGREALLRQVNKGVLNSIAGFVLDRGIARGGERMLDNRDKLVGIVTSGGYSPILKKGIGISYIKSDYAKVGNEIKVEVRGKKLTGRIEKRPFIRRGKGQGQGA